MKSQVFLFAAFAAVAAIADPPAATITDSTIADDVLTVTYTLANGPAVITFDILTNGASIGGEAVVSGVLYGSEVWMKVTGEGPHKIKWRVYAWNGNADISAVVTAWPLDNPPNYMVADISTKAHPNTQRYYPEADFVPGGVLGDTRYRKTALLMRKIMAKGITWTMGNNGSASPWREVTLTNNYYMGVFEVTQAQWAQVKGNYPSKFTLLSAREMRPVEQVAYDEIRVSSGNSWSADYEFPNSPHGSSFLGIVRTRTGIDFDLPGEAQWEYAAHAGHDYSCWGDGTPNSSVNLMTQGRFTGNGGNGNDAANCDTNKGTAVCGSYKPSDFGLYDMHGNVNELCLDWYTSDGAQTNLDYRVNIKPEDPQYMLYPANTKTSSKVKRGGSFAQSAIGTASRNSDAHTTRYYNFGFRVICPVEVP
ncbi:MAG: formylglycine-generating enzyme family protein [Kiritimatiellae bacterium]|nr:formylglycine-generating enzyme family protein [Kiritimatiellia bacterium]